MGVINVLKGLESKRYIHEFNGCLRDNLDLDWEHCKIFLGSMEETPDYEVKENDVLIIHEIPGFTTTALVVTAIVLGAVSLGVGIGAGLYAYNQIKIAQRELEDALKRIGKDNQKKEVGSIPTLADARNERADGKNAPLILGRHVFAPYFLSEPYMRPGGEDGIDLYWYGTFLCGQDGLNFEKIRNGSIDLVSFSENNAQKGAFNFQNPGTIDPPFYDPQNLVEIIQKGHDVIEPIFEQKWVDSLVSSVEIGRKKKDNAEVVDDIFVDDDGADPIEEETARFPMRAEIEIMFDGLHGWNSENGVATDASVSITLEWSVNRTSWNTIPNWNNRVITRNKVQQLRFLAEINFPSSVYDKGGNPIYIRATRNTRMHTGGFRDRVYISAIRTKQYNPNKSSLTQLTAAKNINNIIKDKFCRIGIKLKVNQNTQKNLDRFNIIASMTGRTANGGIDPITNKWKWDGTWSDKIKTSNSAAVLLELMTGLIHHPSRHRDEEIDLYSFGKLYEFCRNQEALIDSVIHNYKDHNFELQCNGVLTGGAKKQDAIRQVLATCDGGLYINEFGRIQVYYDHAQEIPIALLNPARIISMTDQRPLERKADGYAVEFVDQDAEWSQSTHRILRPGVEANPGLNSYSPVKLDYTTSYVQAMWHSRRLMAKEIHRPGEVTVQTGKEGRYYKPGSLIKVQHERFKIGLGSGEITELIVDKSRNEVTGLKLMERFDIADDRDYWIEYYVVDVDRNHVVTKKIQSVGKYTDRLMFTVPIPMDSKDVPLFGNILSALHDEVKTNNNTPILPSVWESKRYLVSDLSENETGYDLSLVQYNDIIYKTTSINNIPPYESSILRSAPKIYDGLERRPIDGGSGQGGFNGNDIRQIADDRINEKTPAIVATVTPRYRGAYTDVGFINSEGQGQIGGYIMNQYDYVMYSGESIPKSWQKARMYEWNGLEWKELSIEENRWKYLDGINDLKDVIIDNVLGTAFVNTLVAATAIIDRIFSRHITMHNPDGVIQSEIFRTETSSQQGEGFRIPSDGLLEIYNAKKLSITGTNIVAIGTKRVYIDNDEVLIQEYMGSNIWRTLISLGIAIGLGTVSCEVPTSGIIEESSSVTYPIYSIAFANSKWVAGGTTQLITSSDGISWVVIDGLGLNRINVICNFNNRWVAGGGGNTGSIKMITSTDGINWTNIANHPFLSNESVYSIAYINNVWIASAYYSANNSKIATSSDGINWSSISNHSLAGFRDIIFTNNRWIAVGVNGKMITSTDGINWTNIANHPFGVTNIYSIAFGNSKWVAVGADGKMATSTDGINWTNIANHPFGTNVINTVAFSNNKWMAGGGAVGVGKIATSTDGINWTEIINHPLVGNQVNTIRFADNKWIIGGGTGGIGKIAFLGDGVSLLQTRFGFTERRITSTAQRLKLSDGNWLNLNSNGTVTWASN